MTSINDSYGRGGFVYLGDTADYQSLKHDPTRSYFKDGIEDVAHLYPVMRFHKPDIQDSRHFVRK